MSGLAVSAGTITRLRTIAEDEGTTPQDLAEKAIRRFLRHEMRQKMRRETDVFRAMHSELRSKYPDQFVAIYRGRLIDHDADQLALFRRVDERYPDVPVLIKQVLPDAEEIYTFRSPRIEDEL